MKLARFAIMLGIVILLIGGIAFILPGEFLFSGNIISFVRTTGSLIIPGLASNPSLSFFIQKSPAFILIILGLILMLVGFVKSTLEPVPKEIQNPKEKKNFYKDIKKF